MLVRSLRIAVLVVSLVVITAAVGATAPAPAAGSGRDGLPGVSLDVGALIRMLWM